MSTESNPLTPVPANFNPGPRPAGPTRNPQEITSMNFAKNAGTLDRALRAIVGLVLIALALTGTIGAWGWIGVVPLVTAALGWCPAYTLLGIKTCPTQQ